MTEQLVVVRPAELLRPVLAMTCHRMPVSFGHVRRARGCCVGRIWMI